MEMPRYQMMGFLVFGLVGMIREWCPYCTRQRYHEVYDGFKICLGGKTEIINGQERFVPCNNTIYPEVAPTEVETTQNAN